MSRAAALQRAAPMMGGVSASGLNCADVVGDSMRPFMVSLLGWVVPNCVPDERRCRHIPSTREHCPDLDPGHPPGILADQIKGQMRRGLHRTGPS